MTFAIAITAIVVGIIAYGVGKLSVYVRQDNERDPALSKDPVQAWGPSQFELWSKAQENGVSAERELAKLVSTLSLVGVASIVALAKLNIVNTLGITILMGVFLLAVFFCIANLQMRQLWFDRRARQLQEAFDERLPVRRLSHHTRTHRIVSVLPTLGAVLFGAALVLVVMDMAARSTNCTDTHAKNGLGHLYCSSFIQAQVVTWDNEHSQASHETPHP